MTTHREKGLIAWFARNPVAANLLMIFILVGGLVAYIGIRDLLFARASLDWLTTEGKIISSSVERKIDRDRDSSTYQAEIQYEFAVNGVTYSGTRVAFGEHGSNNSTHAKDIVFRYPKGSSVTVYYSESDPDTCLLEPGVQAQVWFLPVSGLIVFIIGLFLAVYLPTKN